MLVPGAYFRDEVLWRGRVAGHVCGLTRAIMKWVFG